MKNKYFVVVLCLILALSNITSLSGFATSEVVASGKCGDNTTWVFYDNGEFVVSGNGSMYNWYSWQTNSMPWIAYKSQIKSVRIEEGVTIIGERTFADCTNISTLSLPNSLTIISDYAFEECGIANLTIPNNVTHIGSYAFNGCTKLQNFVLGDNVSSIDSYAFYACSSLKNIVLNIKLEHVGDYAFAGCDSAEYIEIQENVNLIGSEAFISCNNLKEIKVHHNNCCFASDINGVLYDTKNNILIQYPLDNLTIPNNVTHILNTS
ncbi:MAG: leucine-rich repeat domain-containing protein [Ruminococcaceae bacterium]|nr:leucine-rich repeat domain-containing protein [Oscillospiraceae bacterium]